MISEIIDHSTAAPAGWQKQCKNKQQGTIALAKRSYRCFLLAQERFASAIM